MLGREIGLTYDNQFLIWYHLGECEGVALVTTLVRKCQMSLELWSYMSYDNWL